MDNVKINVDDYVEHGLGDTYYGLTSFMSRYVTENFDPMEVFENDKSKYATAVSLMKSRLKDVLDYLKDNDEVYLPELNRNVKISSLTLEEQKALERRCSEYLIQNMDNILNNDLENQNSGKAR